MEFAHRSVLLHECIDALAIKPDGIYLDGTLGGAGHSLEICSALPILQAVLSPNPMSDTFTQLPIPSAENIMFHMGLPMQ